VQPNGSNWDGGGRGTGVVEIPPADAPCVHGRRRTSSRPCRLTSRGGGCWRRCKQGQALHRSTAAGGHPRRVNVARRHPRLDRRPPLPHAVGAAPVTGPQHSRPASPCHSQRLMGPPGRHPPPAVRDTPPPPGRRLDGGPLITAFYPGWHRRRGSSPTHPVMQRAARAGERMATAAGAGARESTAPPRPAWCARAGPYGKSAGYPVPLTGDPVTCMHGHRVAGCF